MEFCIFTEPQDGASYDTLLAHAQTTERLGFTGWFRSDHYLTNTPGSDGLPGPTDAWITLAGLARETSRIRLGTLVSSVTYRHPGLLAIQVAQVDAMSGGRVELGLGTGWFEAEHTAYGIPFPKARFDLLQEQLEIVTGLWSTPLGETYTHEGAAYQLKDSPALPKPVQASIPIIVGGVGKTRTPELAGCFATEYNVPFGTEAASLEAFERVRVAADQHGRTHGDLRYSVAQETVLGRDEADFRARAARSGQDPDRLRADQLGGTPAEVADRIARYAEAGVTRVYLQVRDLQDLEHLELLAEELVGARV